MRPLRLVAWFLILLALGVQTSYGVAWALAGRFGERADDGSRHWMFVADGMPFFATEYFQAGVRQRYISPYNMYAGVDTSSIIDTQVALGNIERWPSWGSINGIGAEKQWFSGYAYGWPWVCMWYETNEWDLGRNETLITGGRKWASSPSLHEWGSPRHVLPLRVAWLPLLANSALYAAAWSLIPLTAYFLPRSIRRRRGACITCGYTLQGLTTPICPECGAARPPDA